MPYPSPSSYDRMMNSSGANLNHSGNRQEQRHPCKAATMSTDSGGPMDHRHHQQHHGTNPSSVRNAMQVGNDSDFVGGMEHVVISRPMRSNSDCSRATTSTSTSSTSGKTSQVSTSGHATATTGLGLDGTKQKSKQHQNQEMKKDQHQMSQNSSFLTTHGGGNGVTTASSGTHKDSADMVTATNSSTCATGVYPPSPALGPFSSSQPRQHTGTMASRMSGGIVDPPPHRYLQQQQQQQPPMHNVPQYNASSGPGSVCVPGPSIRRAPFYNYNHYNRSHGTVTNVPPPSQSHHHHHHHHHPTYAASQVPYAHVHAQNHSPSALMRIPSANNSHSNVQVYPPVACHSSSMGGPGPGAGTSAANNLSGAPDIYHAGNYQGGGGGRYHPNDSSYNHHPYIVDGTNVKTGVIQSEGHLPPMHSSRQSQIQQEHSSDDWNESMQHPFAQYYHHQHPHAPPPVPRPHLGPTPTFPHFQQPLRQEHEYDHPLPRHSECGHPGASNAVANSPPATTHVSKCAAPTSSDARTLPTPTASALSMTEKRNEDNHSSIINNNNNNNNNNSSSNNHIFVGSRSTPMKLQTSTSPLLSSRKSTQSTSLLNYDNIYSHSRPSSGTAGPSSNTDVTPMSCRDRQATTNMERNTKVTQLSTSCKDDTTTLQIGCTCKKSKCLKLYCQCFAAKTMCHDKCRCQECKNDMEHIDERTHAIQTILSRNPQAFETKFKAVIPNELENGGITCNDVGTREVLDTAGKSGTNQDMIGIGGGENVAVAHKTGCKCRRSACLKKYCECFHASVKCSKKCRCVGCKNVATDGGENEDPGGEIVLDKVKMEVEGATSIKARGNQRQVKDSPILDMTNKFMRKSQTNGNHDEDGKNLSEDTYSHVHVMDAAQNLAFMKNMSPERSIFTASSKPNDVRSNSSTLSLSWAQTPKDSTSAHAVPSLTTSDVTDRDDDGSEYERKMNKNFDAISSSSSSDDAVLMAAYAMAELCGTPSRPLVSTANNNDKSNVSSNQSKWSTPTNSNNNSNSNNDNSSSNCIIMSSSSSSSSRSSPEERQDTNHQGNDRKRHWTDTKLDMDCKFETPKSMTFSRKHSQETKQHQQQQQLTSLHPQRHLSNNAITPTLAVEGESPERKKSKTIDVDYSSPASIPKLSRSIGVCETLTAQLDDEAKKNNITYA